jgi:hypothetical protein
MVLSAKKKKKKKKKKPIYDRGLKYTKSPISMRYLYSTNNTVPFSLLSHYENTLIIMASLVQFPPRKALTSGIK